LSGIALWIFLCAAAFIWLAWLLRRDRLSLGLPIAYMIMLLLIHLPGAFTPLLSDQFGYHADAIEIGIRFTAIGCLCFVGGVYAAHFLCSKRHPIYIYVDRRKFWYFCLAGGLFIQFALTFLGDLPSVRSALERGSLLWTLGPLLGLRFALSQGNLTGMASWSAAALISPIFILLGGFLGYGSVAIIIVVSALVVSVRSRLKLITVGTLIVYLGLSIFVNYFAHRKEFREIAWSAASTGERVSAAVAMFSDFQWFDPTDVTQLSALDIRLNQNYFVGLAAERIQQDQVTYLYGRSLWEGIIALVPRALWPDKPVFGGSGTIVVDMTGLNLDQKNTSWGVGNVMEFQVNFGTPGVVIGFLILGFLLGWLDYKAAAADARGDTGKLILFFLLGVALTQPGASIVEMSGGAAAAGVAAYIWKWLWQFWLQRSNRRDVGREFAALR